MTREYAINYIVIPKLIQGLCLSEAKTGFLGGGAGRIRSVQVCECIGVGARWLWARGKIPDCSWEFPKKHGPDRDPKRAGLLLQGRPQKGAPTYRNSQVTFEVSRAHLHGSGALNARELRQQSRFSPPPIFDVMNFGQRTAVHLASDSTKHKLRA